MSLHLRISRAPQVQSRLLREGAIADATTNVRKTSWFALAGERAADAIVRGNSRMPLFEAGRVSAVAATVDESSIGYVFSSYRGAVL